jgi:dienelactone hydrolase
MRISAPTVACAVGIALALAISPAARGEGEGRVQALRTPGGVGFAVLGEKPAAPAPTLFVFAAGAEETLANEDYVKVGRLVARHGWLCVALDVPCHGRDVRKESAGLVGWRGRLEKGEPLVSAFTAKASLVLEYLVKERYTDPRRVAACGTSRGGFMALHFVAAEPRVAAVIAFAPVTDLLALREFAGMDKHEATRALALDRHADRLAGRPVWLCIGNQDDRVDTDRVIAFTRRLVAAAKKPLAPVELHVMPTVGHRIHATAHDEAAAWLLAQTAARPASKPTP